MHASWQGQGLQEVSTQAVDRTLQGTCNEPDLGLTIQMFYMFDFILTL